LGAAAYNPRMLQTIQQTLAVAAVQRVCLLLNHVLVSEAVATARLKPHAGRYVRLHLAGWPSMLPTPPDLVFGITPAGLLEWGGDAPPAQVDLNLTVEAGNPLLAALHSLGGERPKVSVEGDAELAADVSWLVDNLRWDMQDDLARVVGEVPAREIARVGGVLAGGLRAAVQGLTGLASRVSAP
jgi:ubiquinone biosynthesis protein UbiJ